ncbi:MAG: 30S ribosomal protein S9 [Patescibacteria group bacterium]|nr:30S ribosomal protein S9 [Patescibacteria group bacterium]
MQKIQKTKDKEKKDKAEIIKFKGKYISAIGRRKTSVSRVRLYKKGDGHIMVNEKKADIFFTPDCILIINQPLKLTGHLKDIDISILSKGGGKKGQADAARHGIARALISLDENLKPAIKAKGWLTRDARRKERKKPGLKKARKAPQWSKR